MLKDKKFEKNLLGCAEQDSIPPIYLRALDFIIVVGEVSLSHLLRHLKVGFKQTRRILLWLKNMEYVCIPKGKNRGLLLLTREEFNARYTDEVPQIYIDALHLVVAKGQVSISMLQRELNILYGQAGRILLWLEYMNYISAFDGVTERKVIITHEELHAMYGSYNNKIN